MKKTFSLLPLILLAIFYLCGPLYSTHGPEDPGERFCLGIAGLAIPSVEYFINDNDNAKWGLHFAMEPTFFFEDPRTLGGFFNQIRLNYTYLFSEDDIIRLHYVPFVSIANTLTIGIPLGIYRHSGDNGYSAGAILELYFSGTKYARMTFGYDYRYNPENNKSGNAFYGGIRLNTFFFSNKKSK